MNKPFTCKTIVVSLLLLFSQFSSAQTNEIDGAAAQIKEQHTPLEYLHLMQQAYQQKNYEILYLNSLQQQLDPMQLIHGVVDNNEVTYFRYLNGAIRESLQYAGKISYFEQGTPAYTLKSRHNRSAFANIANFNYDQGQSSYEYVILGKGRIAGKQAIAIRMISKDEYRYSYVIWCDLKSYLPLRLDTLNQSNVVVEQIMVISLNTTDEINPWLAELTQKPLPNIVHIPESKTGNNSLWEVTWLPEGFDIVKEDQHQLVNQEREVVSYIMLTDGIVNVSIYISDKKIPLDAKQKLIQRGVTILYTEQKGHIEVNVVGEIPIKTAKKLVESLKLVKNDN